MTDDFDACLAFAMLPANDGQPFHETPGDPGGATAWGVTFSTFCAWRASHRQPKPTVDDLRNISVAERDALYGALFWNTIRGASLPPGVNLMVFDDGVVGGPGSAARQLQEAVGVAQDGSIGPQTLAAVAKVDIGELLAKLDAIGKAAYARGNREFVAGWENRLARRFAAAQAMAAPPASAPPAPPTQPVVRLTASPDPTLAAGPETADDLMAAELEQLGADPST